MPDYEYDVQGCEIDSTEIDRLMDPVQVPNFDRIVIHLRRRGTTNYIDIEPPYAVDHQGQRLTDVIVDSYNRKDVTLRNPFNDDFGQFCFITKCMITAFDSPSLELKARKHRYRGIQHPTHTGKHFIGYKVKVKKH